jgi:hypothetical protein
MEIDTSLEAAVHLASQPDYLGDPAVIGEILHDLWAGTLQRHEHVTDPRDMVALDAAIAADIAACENVAAIFLGKYEDWTAMPAWNCPGVIDRYVAEMVHVDDDDPVHRISFALIKFLGELFALVGAVNRGEVADDAFSMKASAVSLKYIKMLMGVTDPTVSIQAPTSATQRSTLRA